MIKKIILVFVFILTSILPLSLSANEQHFQITQEELNLCKLHGIDENSLNGFISDRKGWGLSDDEIDARLRQLIYEVKQTTPTSVDATKTETINIENLKTESFEIVIKKMIRNCMYYIFPLMVSVMSIYLLFAAIKKKNNYSILGIITFLYLCSVVIFTPDVYGVYQLLRWVVTSFSAWTAFKIYKKSPQDFSLMIFSAIAILFNPILPIKFEQEVWLCIDVLTALVILTYAIKSLREK